MLKSVKDATPVVDVVTALVPTRVPGPEFKVAVMVYSSEDSLTEVRVLEYLSCKVAVGGGENTTAMNLSTR